MFERYDEPARRSLFFARYEASNLGSGKIESVHLLFGLMRQPAPAVLALLDGLPLTEIRRQLEAGFESRAPIPTSVEIPFTDAAKRVLGLAAEEADRLEHRHIGTEHLLLALLHDDGSEVAAAFSKHGLTLETARAKVRLPIVALPKPVAADANARALVARLMDLVEQLATAVEGNREAMFTMTMIRLDVEDLKARLDWTP